MKKLITIITAIFALSVGAMSIHAAPAKYKPKVNKKTYKKFKKKKKRFRNVNLYNGHYNRRGVYIYYTTRIVQTWRGKYKNTYKHKIFPNGRHKVKLVKSKKINHVYPVRVRFKTKTVYRNGVKYRVRFKIVKYSNGRVKRYPVHRRPVW
ncbi:MAG: hypothetical protein HKN33_06470 [Pyrinomonadaceae bacterium]|nr:hypothetical protein [Pyrinomonadaceae bacterium]